MDFLDEIAALTPVPAGGAAAGMAGTAHVVRENLKPIKSPDKQQRYLEGLESLYEQRMAKKKEVLESFWVHLALGHCNAG